MTATVYSNPIAMPAAIRDHDLGVLLPSLNKDANEPAIRPMNIGFVDAAAVSQAVHGLDQKLSSPQAADPVHHAENEAEIPQQSTQQIHVPVMVSNVHEQEGRTTIAIQYSTQPTANAEIIEPKSSDMAKARFENITVTPAMEAYANDAATLPIHTATDTTKTRFPDLGYHNPLSLSSATRLKRRLLETDELIVCPGVYDGFSARIALSVGFTALYMVRCLCLSSLAHSN